MHALTEAAIRRSMVNCSRSEAASLTPPRDLAERDWASLDVLGWRDAKAELRGYLVHEQDGDPIGIALRAADTKMSSRRSAMCLLCHSVQSAADVSLFAARRVGEAGRNGNTVGTYICADLGCASRVTAVPPSAQHLDEELQALAIEEQAIGLRKRLQAFTADVTRR
ncbi:FBP domain-containing protein [Modestobacter sp. VKM Ac-2985]|uniref:FBP domain-containing protein n=1 Tax=Modestobacter sp. VKM Ac-2985 TaxID=3004139 RepID=UPI0022ABACEA|nr:FBP domain-containing protein [Modestobacter sp. VKM Ac-2985]MCZ2838099.1 FBP domain-containing protein [Modestobacter sp. VKM Ac-2985]